MVSINGEIKADIKANHPKVPYADSPVGFSSLFVSPSEKYGADVKFFINDSSSSDDKKTEPNIMIRILDFSKKEFSYFWAIMPTIKNYPTGFKVIWMSDSAVFLVFQEVKESRLTYAKFHIDHKESTMKEILNRSVMMDKTVSFIEESIFPSNFDYYFATHKDKNGLLHFESVDQKPKGRKTMEIPKECSSAGEDFVIDEGFTFVWAGYAYFGGHRKENGPNKSRKTHLIRIKTKSFIKEKANKFGNEELKNAEVMEIPGEFWFLQSYNKKRLLFRYLKYGELKYFAVDLKTFSCKTIDFSIKPGEFPVCYGNNLMVLNHYESKSDSYFSSSTPLPKDTPLIFRLYQNLLCSDESTAVANDSSFIELFSVLKTNN